MHYHTQPTAIEEEIGKAIVNAAYRVHKELGPGLTEGIYEVCMNYALQQQGYVTERQKMLPVYFEGMRMEHSLKLDILVEGLVIVELKAVESLQPIHTAQILSYLKITDLRLGFLINFNVPLIRDGIKRHIQQPKYPQNNPL